MDWSALPVAGGIYDQHPALIDQWMIIFDEKRQYQEEQNSPDKKLGDKQLHVPRKFKKR